MGNLIAFLWGFAEATLFFVVPDVGLSILALQGSTAGLVAAGYAVLGALVGGTLMWYWGQADLERVAAILHRIPLIPAEDIEKVQADMARSGAAAMFLGPMSGIPYKIYAAYGHRFTSFGVFLLVSIPARGIRFVIISLMIPFIYDRFFPGLSDASRMVSLLIFWIAVYIFYFFTKRK